MPLRRASESPIAIACLRLVTLRPDLPERSLPRFISCISSRTFSLADGLYLRRVMRLREVDFFRDVDLRLRVVAFFRVPVALREAFLREVLDFFRDGDFFREVDFFREEDLLREDFRVVVFLRAVVFLRVVVFFLRPAVLRETLFFRGAGISTSSLGGAAKANDGSSPRRTLGTYSRFTCVSNVRRTSASVASR